MLRKIMIVDDSELIHQMCRVLLSRYRGTKLVHAHDGQEALDKLAQEADIDLLLLDINMPVMNGLELLRRMKRHPEWACIPVVIISTDGTEQHTERGLKMGAVGYIAKPFTASELHAAIRDATGTRPTGPENP